MEPASAKAAHLKRVGVVLALAILQVALMFFAYGLPFDAARPVRIFAVTLFLGAPFVAGYLEFRSLESLEVHPHNAIAVAVGVTLVATYLGFFLGVNTYGE